MSKDPHFVPTSLAQPASKRARAWKRRTLVGASGTALGLTGAAYAAYRAAPGFWKNFYSDLQRPMLDPNFIPDPASWPDTGLHAAWLGHSTVLLKVNGFTILTDPIFSDHAGIHLGVLSVGVKRQIRSALEPEMLPPVDLVLVSHAHMDHLDIPSLRMLQDPATTVVTARHTSDLFRGQRFREVRELGWDERTRIGPATVRATEVNHWGARMRVDTYRGYNGYQLEVDGIRILFAGDTAQSDAFRRLRSSKPHALVVMPIGAYNPWIRYHCTPEQAWKMAADAGFEHFMPVHHQTFPLSQEPSHEPIERLLSMAKSHEDRIALQQVGEEIHLI
ncbi:MAG: MBL fold metallo-hydrolase [Bryobacterales bacterium]|nr:MBL fold metallo-hydrolase [Bryobacterales bacterium]